MKWTLLLLSSLVILSACSEEGGDLQSWMQQERASAKAKIKPVEAPPAVEPITYIAPPPVEPNAFKAARLQAAYQSADMPDMNRPKEFLEGFSLENLKYVGFISNANGSDIKAMVDAEGHIYMVGMGNHLGQNFGKIVAIDEAGITVEEVVESVTGGWETRKAIVPRSGIEDSK